MTFGEQFVNDPAEKVFWVQKAADQGFTAAMTEMTQIYLAEGPQKDPKLATFWLRKAIANGDGNALMKFADLSCDTGKNGSLAVATMKYALTVTSDEVNRPWVSLDLARTYANGTCVPQDSLAAFRY